MNNCLSLKEMDGVFYGYPKFSSNVDGSGKFSCGVASLCTTHLESCEQLHGIPTCVACSKDDFHSRCFTSRHPPNCTLYCTDQLQQYLAEACFSLNKPETTEWKTGFYIVLAVLLVVAIILIIAISCWLYRRHINPGQKGDCNSTEGEEQVSLNQKDPDWPIVVQATADTQGGVHSEGATGLSDHHSTQRKADF